MPTTEILRLHCAQSSLLTPSLLPPLGQHDSSWRSLSDVSPTYETRGAESKEARPCWVRPIPMESLLESLLPSSAPAPHPAGPRGLPDSWLPVHFPVFP